MAIFEATRHLTSVFVSASIQKDPFYELEMPIRCELFTNAIDGLIERVAIEGVGKAR